MTDTGSYNDPQRGEEQSQSRSRPRNREQVPELEIEEQRSRSRSRTMEKGIRDSRDSSGSQSDGDRAQWSGSDNNQSVKTKNREVSDRSTARHKGPARRTSDAADDSRQRSSSQSSRQSGRKHSKSSAVVNSDVDTSLESERVLKGGLGETSGQPQPVDRIEPILSTHPASPEVSTAHKSSHRSLHNPFSRSSTKKSKALQLERTQSVSFLDSVTVGGAENKGSFKLSTNYRAGPSTRRRRLSTADSSDFDGDDTQTEDGFTDDGATDVDEDEDDDDDATTTTSMTDDDEDNEEERHQDGHNLPFLAIWRKFRPPKPRASDEHGEGSSPNGDAEAGNPQGDTASTDLNLYRRTPMISGAIAPFAIMLEIPGFTSKWYVRTGPDHRPVAYRPNPVILDVGLSISFAAAVLANLFIILRFLELMRPRRSTILAIMGFMLHDTINTIALTIFGVVHRFNDGFTYAESFWMTTGSTVASLIVTGTLVADYVNTKNFKDAGSGLTSKQKELVIIIMVLLLYMSLGSLIFALILKLPFEDSLYFTLATMTTVGFGDITPSNTGSRIFLFFFAPLGIVIVALVITTARLTILEEFQHTALVRSKAFRERHALRQKTRKEQNHLRRRFRKMAGRGGVARSPEQLLRLQAELKLTEQEVAGQKQKQKAETRPAPSAPWSLSSFTSFRNGNMKDGWSSRPATLSPIQEPTQSPFTIPSYQMQALPHAGPQPQDLEEKASPLEENSSSNDGSSNDKSPPNEAQTSEDAEDEVARMEAALQAQREALENEWKEYRESLKSSERTTFWVKISVSWLLFLLFWAIGAVVFSKTESWTFFEGLYFCFVFFSTIGYGDYSPKTPAGRAFFIVWALFGIGIVTILFAVAGDAFGSNFKLAMTKASARNMRRNKKHRARRRGRAHRGSDGADPDQSQEAEEEQDENSRSAQDQQTESVYDGNEEDPGTQAQVSDSPQSLAADASSILRSESPLQLTQSSPSALGAAPSRQATSATSSKFPTHLFRRNTTSKNPGALPDQNSTLGHHRQSTSMRSANSTTPLQAGNEKSDAQAEAHSTPIEDLPLHLARSAMSFHKSANRFIETQKTTLSQMIHMIPDVSEVIPSRFGGTADPSANSHNQEKTRENVEILRASIKQYQGDEGVAAAEQIFALIDFEEHLHIVLSSASQLRETIISQNAELEALRSFKTRHESERMKSVPSSSTSSVADIADTSARADEVESKHHDEQ